MEFLSDTWWEDIVIVTEIIRDFLLFRDRNPKDPWLITGIICWCIVPIVFPFGWFLVSGWHLMMKLQNLLCKLVNREL